jgi:hypothetical protein
MSLFSTRYVTGYPTSPEGVVDAPIGTPMIDESTGYFYIKQSARGLRTGWSRIDQVSNVRATGSTQDRTIQNRFSDRFHLKDWGGVSDGVTNDSAALNSAIASVSNLGGSGLRLPSGTTKCLNQIVLADGLHLVGDPSGKTILDLSQGESATGLLGEGSLSSLPALGSNVSLGATTITFASAHNLSENDVFIIHVASNNSFSSSATNYQDGEYFEVAKVVSSTVVMVTKAAFSSYTAGTTTNWKQVPIRVRFSNITFRFKQGLGTGIPGIRVKFGRGLILENCKLSGSQYAQIWIDRCYDTILRDLEFFDNQSTIGNNYGAVIGNSQKGAVINCRGTTLRHPITWGGSTGDAIVPNRDWEIIGGHYESLDESWAVDVHGNSEWFTFLGVHSGCGMVVGGDNMKATACTLGNRNSSGVCFSHREPRGMNVTLENSNLYASQSFNGGLVSLMAYSSISVQSRIFLQGNRYDFRGFGSSTYPSADSVGVQFGYSSTPSNTDIRLYSKNEIFTTSSTTAGPTYAYYGVSGTGSFKEVSIENISADKMGVKIYKNVERVRVTGRISDALQYGFIGLSVSSPTYSYQDWVIGAIIERSKLDGVRILQAVATDDVTVKTGCIKNNGQASSASSIVVVNARQLKFEQIEIGDDQAVATQTTLAVVQGVTTWIRKGVVNVGAELNSLDYSVSTVTKEIDLDKQGPVNAISSTTIDCRKGTDFTKSISAAQAYAFTNPPPAGYHQRVVVRLLNSTGGALTPTSFTATSFTTTLTIAAIPAGKYAVFTFDIWGDGIINGVQENMP